MKTASLESANFRHHPVRSKQTVTESFKTPAWLVGVRTMPFQQYAPFFGPEELKSLTVAFDATWQELSANPDLSADPRYVSCMQQKGFVQRPN